MFDSSKIVNWKPTNLSSEETLDGQIYHRSLYFDDLALKARKWHRDATQPLINLVLDKIKNGDVIVDYGSGTGGSAIELVKKLDDLDLDYKLILVDPLGSWFSKAYDLLKERPNVFFCKSYGKNLQGSFAFLTLDELLGGNKVDLIISSSTIHLIPENILPSLFSEFYNNLSDEGNFIWSSGDIPSKILPSGCNLLHDPYREILKSIRNNSLYHNFESSFGEASIIKMRKRADNIFPLSNDIEYYTNTLHKSKFKGKVFTEIVSKSIEECKLFMKTPRLSEVASLITNHEERNDFINKLLNNLFDNSDSDLFTNGKNYRSYWHYGVFERVQ